MSGYCRSSTLPQRHTSSRRHAGDGALKQQAADWDFLAAMDRVVVQHLISLLLLTLQVSLFVAHWQTLPGLCPSAVHASTNMQALLDALPTLTIAGAGHNAQPGRLGPSELRHWLDEQQMLGNRAIVLVIQMDHKGASVESRSNVPEQHGMHKGQKNMILGQRQRQPAGYGQKRPVSSSPDMSASRPKRLSCDDQCQAEETDIDCHETGRRNILSCNGTCIRRTKDDRNDVIQSYWLKGRSLTQLDKKFINRIAKMSDGHEGVCSFPGMCHAKCSVPRSDCCVNEMRLKTCVTCLRKEYLDKLVNISTGAMASPKPTCLPTTSIPGPPGFCANAVCMENENMIQKKIGQRIKWFKSNPRPAELQHGITSRRLEMNFTESGGGQGSEFISYSEGRVKLTKKLGRYDVKLEVFVTHDCSSNSYANVTVRLLLAKWSDVNQDQSDPGIAMKGKTATTHLSRTAGTRSLHVSKSIDNNYQALEVTAYIKVMQSSENLLLDPPISFIHANLMVQYSGKV